MIIYTFMRILFIFISAVVMQMTLKVNKFNLKMLSLYCSKGFYYFLTESSFTFLTMSDI
jgi:hypothetical protein